MEFVKGYRGFWCDELCWRISHVLSNEDMWNNVRPEPELWQAFRKEFYLDEPHEVPEFTY